MTACIFSVTTDLNRHNLECSLIIRNQECLDSCSLAVNQLPETSGKKLCFKTTRFQEISEMLQNC